MKHGLWAACAIALGLMVGIPGQNRSQLDREDLVGQFGELQIEQRTHVVGLVSHGQAESEGASPRPQDGHLLGDFDPNDVLGEARCVDCHRKAFDRWRATGHSRGFAKLQTALIGTLEDYAGAVELPVGDVLRKGACIDCHSPPRGGYPQPGTYPPSVGCEVCHGPAGGESGWLDLHFNYGFEKTRATEDEDHFAARESDIANSTMVRSSDALQMARRCVVCHIPTHKGLYEAGHEQKATPLSVDNYVGAIRHNFHLKPNNNQLVSSLWLAARENLELGERTEAGRLRFYSLLLPLVETEFLGKHLLEAEAIVEAEDEDEYDADEERDDGDFIESLAGRMLKAAERLGEGLEETDWFDDANDALSEILTAQADLILGDPDDLEEGLGDLEDYLEELAEVEEEVASAIEREIWLLYKSLQSWAGIFDEKGVRNAFAHNYDGVDFDYSRDAFATYLRSVTSQLQTLESRFGDGATLEFLELSVDTE